MYTLDGEFLEKCDSQQEAAKKYNVPATNIAKVCRGKLKTAGKHIFKYG